MNRSNHRVEAPRGFTLVELMVALSGGIFFTIFVFMMSKDAATFFQGQARNSETTLATITGFERLRNDIARAGYLASPNILRDANRCPRPLEGDPGPAQQIGTDFSTYRGLQEMGLAHITSGAVTSNFMLANNAGGLDSDQIILWGNYSTAEQFPVRAINAGGGSIYLEVGSTSLLREGIDGVTAAADLAALQRIFRVGGIIRIVDETSREQYSIITGVSHSNLDGVNVPTIQYGGVGLIDKANNPRCGLHVHGAGTSVNPVDIIRYRLTSLAADPNFNQLLYTGSAGTTDNTRLELIREKLNPLATSTTITAASIFETELIAEYAVDLKFGLTVQSSPATGALTYYGEDDTNIPRYAGLNDSTAAIAANSGPHLIRGIHARLAIRNRDPDREAPALSATAIGTATSEDLIRVQVGTNQFARMRSLRSHIATRNTRNELWN